MKDIDKISSVVNQLVRLSDPSITVNLEEDCPLNRRIGGKYNLQQHSVTLYVAEIEKQCKLLFPGEKVFMDYFTVVLAHELGHATDVSLLKLSTFHDKAIEPLQKRKIELLIEVQAWNIAKKLLPNIPSSFFNKIKHHSLKSYYQEINKYYVEAHIA